QASDTFEDHQLIFDEPLSAERHLLKDGLYTSETETVLTESATLPLHYEWFDKDAMVFKHLKATSVQLRGPGSQSLDFQFTGFPYLGIWTKRNAPFICIEPWFGLADYDHHQQDIFEKQGIQVIESKETFTCHYSMTLNP
ncbi:MAG: aldose 1-epimerase family protein, partial [Bacteroidota bacterium]